MANKKVILVFATLLLITGLIVIVSTIAGGLILEPGSSEDTGEVEYKIECSGEVRIPLAGLGKTKLSDVSCRKTKCGWLPFSIFSEKGNLKLYVDGEYQDSTTWRSTLGTNQDFTLKSSCLIDPSSAEVVLYDDNNQRLDSLEVDLK